MPQTIQQKLDSAPFSNFIQSLQDFYDDNGYLTANQENKLNVILEDVRYAKEKQLLKNQKNKDQHYEDADPETLEDLLL